MILRVIQYPDEVLRAICDPVTVFDDTHKQFYGKLIDTMRHHRGYGLAAPQVGKTIRVIAISQTVGVPWALMINPVIVNKSAETSVEREGCLSIEEGVPRFEVRRHNRITVEFMTRTGKPVSLNLAGLAARVVQHECDHLDGRLVIDPVV